MPADASVDFAQLTDPAQVTPALRQALVDCWVAVANSGGAVGFAFPPVDFAQVAAVADQMIAELDADYSRLLLAEVGGALAGWLHLSRHRDPLVVHWGTLTRVQTHPEFRGFDVGIALMHEARRIARDEMGAAARGWRISTAGLAGTKSDAGPARRGSTTAIATRSSCSWRRCRCGATRAARARLPDPHGTHPGRRRADPESSPRSLV